MTTPAQGSQEPPQQPPPVDGAAREQASAAAALAIVAAYAAAEPLIIMAIAASIRAALAGRTVTRAQALKLARRVASILSAARREARRAAAAHGITEEPPKPPRPPRGRDATSVRRRLPLPGQTLARDGVGDILDRAERNALQSAVLTYQQAIADAIAATRGGMPATSTSLSAMQAAQKALDRLAAEGITGFTDRTGRNWSLPAYVEMATRTAISQAYDDLQNAAMTRAGIDLIWTYTNSTEGSCPRCLPWLGKVLSLTGHDGTADVTLASGQRFTGHAVATLDEAKMAGFRHQQCRCEWTGLYNGVDLSVLGQGAEPADKASAAYKASQEQRALERKVRAAGRAAAAALTPAAKREARKKLADARAASAAHRKAKGVRQTQVNVRRREHPQGPPGGPAR